MKISKALLQAIVVAVTVGAVSSCGKTVETKTSKEPAIKKSQNDNVPYDCPACGMG